MALELRWEQAWAGGPDAQAGAQDLTTAKAVAWGKAAALCVLLFNLADGLFTLAYLEVGYAEEANPLMRAAYELSPWAFVLLKVVLVQGGVGLLCRCLGKPYVGVLLVSAATVYASVVGYHVAFLIRLLHS